MKVITVANIKGGVGKSTITLNLAHAFKDNLRTSILDLDPQGSLIQASNKVKGINISPWSKKAMDALEGEDVIFIDTPPYIGQNLPYVLQSSDLVLIPTKAGVFDIHATLATVELIKSVQEKKPSLKVAVILNLINKTTTLTDEAKKILETVPYTTLNTSLTERMSFVRSAALENGIYSTNDRKAISELNNLTRDLLFLLNK